MSRVPRRRTAAAPLAIVALVVFAAVAGWFAPYRPDALAGDPLEPPSRAHLLGTNSVGQDLASQLLVGERASITIAGVAAVVAAVAGSAIGCAAALAPPRVDRALMRGVDLFLAVPRLPLLVLLAVYVGGSAVATALVIAGVLWPLTARVVRGRLTGLQRSGYVLAARGFGARRRHVIRHHVLPEVTPLALGMAIVAASRAVVMESGLALLGIGDVTRTSWGATIREALDFRSLFRTDAWRWWLVPPVVAVSVVTMILALGGERLERRTRGLA